MEHRLFTLLLCLLLPLTSALAADKGFLQVNVSAEAEIFVNDVHMGQTGPGRALNIKRGFPVGSVKVRVEAAGMAPVEKSYRITANQWTQAIFDLREEQRAAPAAPTPPQKAFTEPRQAEPPTYAAADATSIGIQLRSCNRHFDANRLTTPAGANAAECYRDVLARDPRNETALRGMRAIERKYGGWTESAIDKGELDKARSYLARLESAAPQSPSIPRLRAAIDEAQRRSVSVYQPPAPVGQPPVKIEVTRAPEPVRHQQAPSEAASAPVWQPTPAAAPQPPAAGGASGGWRNPDAAASPARTPAQPLPVLPAQPALRAGSADLGKIEMIRIPGGCYTMGSPTAEPGRENHERQHRACVDDFDIGKYEVKLVDFVLFTRETGYLTDAERNSAPGQGCFSQDASGHRSYVAGRSWRDPGFPQGEDHPVVCVSWRDANAYVDWLNQRTGQRFRLPTEAEWEYAARADNPGASPWEGLPWTACQHGNVADLSGRRKYPYFEALQCDDGFADTAPVGRFTPNVFGLQDMLSNVSEWTCSAYSEGYHGPENHCASVGDGGLRVHRGGAWNTQTSILRFAARHNQHSGARFDNIGFRLARSAIPGR